MATQEKNLADESVKNEGGGTQATGGKAEAKIEDRTGLYISIVALTLAAIGFGYVLSIKNEAIAQAETAKAIAHAAQDKADIAEREARMQQYYILEVDGKLIKLGVELPEGGYQRFKEKRGSK